MRAGGPVERVPGSDFHAVEHGYVSITPLHADMCSQQAMRDAAQRFGDLAAQFEREAVK